MQATMNTNKTMNTNRIMSAVFFALTSEVAVSIRTKSDTRESMSEHFEEVTLPEGFPENFGDDWADVPTTLPELEFTCQVAGEKVLFNGFGFRGNRALGKITFVPTGDGDPVDADEVFDTCVSTDVDLDETKKHLFMWNSNKQVSKKLLTNSDKFEKSFLDDVQKDVRRARCGDGDFPVGVRSAFAHVLVLYGIKEGGHYYGQDWGTILMTYFALDKIKQRKKPVDSTESIGVDDLQKLYNALKALVPENFDLGLIPIELSQLVKQRGFSHPGRLDGQDFMECKFTGYSSAIADYFSQAESTFPAFVARVFDSVAKNGRTYLFAISLALDAEPTTVDFSKDKFEAMNHLMIYNNLIPQKFGDSEEELNRFFGTVDEIFAKWDLEQRNNAIWNHERVSKMPHITELKSKIPIVKAAVQNDFKVFLVSKEDDAVKDFSEKVVKAAEPVMAHLMDEQKKEFIAQIYGWMLAAPNTVFKWWNFQKKLQSKHKRASLARRSALAYLFHEYSELVPVDSKRKKLTIWEAADKIKEFAKKNGFKKNSNQFKLVAPVTKKSKRKPKTTKKSRWLFWKK